MVSIKMRWNLHKLTALKSYPLVIIPVIIPWQIVLEHTPQTWHYVRSY